MSRPGLLLEPEELQALIRKAHEERSQAMASVLKRAYAWFLRRPQASAAPPAPKRRPERLQTMLEQRWALTQARTPLATRRHRS